MPDPTMLLIDLAAITILTVAVYFRRHRRRDLVVAFFGVNIGVYAVAYVLGASEVAVGLGLGLFGVLSIIRLRSSEISQREVAYYFAALAMGLIAGLTPAFSVAPTALIALIVAVLAVVDHPALFAATRHRTIRLDEAIADEDELRAVVGTRVGGDIRSLHVQHLDFVDDTTIVDIRYRVGARRGSGAAAPREEVAA
ncbi:DUF4956 domain-containing protein [Microbacterium karelineae]|uniref:DUF4956 domain-containing protein n=1 Tax=Microbacterium karelineae TaxID=2654283 RepID=UPI0012E9EE64|nr:DUF4956 domain-containing protein [Microbacterium karelineae]